MNKVSFDIAMTERDTLDFMRYQPIHSAAGIIRIIVAIVCAAFGIAFLAKVPGTSIILLLFAVVMLLHVPMTAKSRAKRQMASPGYSDSVHFTLEDKGISILQKEKTALLPWDLVVKVRKSRSSILIYVGKAQAIIFPITALGNKYDHVKSVITKKVPAKLVRL